MLGGHNDRLDTDGRVVLVVSEGHLRLAIRAQTVDGAVVSNLCEAMRQLVCRPDRGRHQIRCLIGCISEHEALVAGALKFARVSCISPFTCFKRTFHSPGNVRALLADRHGDTARGAVESNSRRGVSDAADFLANDLRNFHVGAVRGYFTHDMHLAGGGENLDRGTCMWVLFEQCIKD